MPPAALQARPATGLIDASIDILRRRYWDLFLAQLIPASPVLVIAAFVSSGSVGYVEMGERFAAPLAIATTAHLVSQEFTGRDVSLGEALGRALRRSPGLIGVAIVIGFSILLGAIALIVGAFVIAAWLYTALPVYALENVNATNALDRSMALSRGNVMHILGVLIPASLAATISASIVGAVVALTRVLLLSHADIPMRVQTVTVMLAALACRPLADVPPTVMYYDLRVRREGMDVEVLAAALGASGEGAPPAEPRLPNEPGATPA